MKISSTGQRMAKMLLLWLLIVGSMWFQPSSSASAQATIPSTILASVSLPTATVMSSTQGGSMVTLQSRYRVLQNVTQQNLLLEVEYGDQLITAAESLQELQLGDEITSQISLQLSDGFQVARWKVSNVVVEELPFYLNNGKISTVRNPLYTQFFLGAPRDIHTWPQFPTEVIFVNATIGITKTAENGVANLPYGLYSFEYPNHLKHFSAKVMADGYVEVARKVIDAYTTR